jgi:hypothetical protein
MPTSLTSSLVLNPALSASFSEAKTKVTEGIKSGINGVPYYVVFAGIFVLIWLIWLFNTVYWSMPNEGNIRNILQTK